MKSDPLSPPALYLEALIPLALAPISRHPPDELLREIAYRMVRQRIAPLAVIEHDGMVYIIGFQRGNLVVFKIRPPEKDDEEKKFRGWSYRTIRDPKKVPTDVIRAGIRILFEHAHN